MDEKGDEGLKHDGGGRVHLVGLGVSIASVKKKKKRWTDQPFRTCGSLCLTLLERRLCVLRFTHSMSIHLLLLLLLLYFT